MSTNPPEKTRRRDPAITFREKRVPLRMLLPSFFTLLGLCAGLTAIRMGMEGRWELAVAAIVLAAAMDGIDGRIARLFKASTKFGAELDSLADFVNFGVAPAVMLFVWALAPLKSLGWIVVLAYAMCAALRLARFNSALETEQPKYQKNYFQGIPAPMAALVVLLPIYIGELALLDLREFPPVVMGYIAFVAFMMVSEVPTYSGKADTGPVPRKYIVPLFMTAMFYVFFLVSYPYATLAATSLAYLATIPLGVRAYRRAADRHIREAAQQAGKVQSL